MSNIKKKYHIDIYMEDSIIKEALKVQRELTSIKYSKHILERMSNKDSKHPFERQDSVRALNKAKRSPVIPFEVETTNNKLSKLVIRLPHNEQKDIIVVLGLHDNLVLCVTAWTNDVKDLHYTLDTNAYEHK